MWVLHCTTSSIMDSFEVRHLDQHLVMAGRINLIRKLSSAVELVGTRVDPPPLLQELIIIA